jgi:hypothetical protein
VTYARQGAEKLVRASNSGHSETAVVHVRDVEALINEVDPLAVTCPNCASDESELGHVGYPCCDVGGGRVQMVCLARIRALSTQEMPHE